MSEPKSPEVFVKGDPEEGTKNSETRRVPLIAEARTLFEKMRSDRESEPASSKVFVVNECQHSMDAAAEKIGMARITHHDLRHFFATICIESRVDIPTVSRWLGHKDGGALAMRTDGHLRREHSLASSSAESFVRAHRSGGRIGSGCSRAPREGNLKQSVICGRLNRAAEVRG
ncbi:MAG TPA: tyrosine-type recombinase/integrase [Chthoniobacteraceae bacterium]|jgi:integrase|nr:tyrosine-type recombinase/integrase [Chthoniobacteraceae bacterium]